MKKRLKKVLSVVLALSVVLTCSIASFAASNDGQITITNAAKDKTYSVYKVFDATVSSDETKISYTYDGILPANDYFTQDASGNITATAKALAKEGSTELVAAAVEFLGTLVKDTDPVDSKKASETGALVFSNLPYGYYYISTDNGSAVSITSTKKTAEVVDKNKEIVFEKKIVEGSNLVSDNAVNVGDKIDYKITLTAKNNDGNKYITDYVVFDTMDEALTYNEDIVIKVNGTEVTGTRVKGANDPYTFIYKIPWTKDNGDFLYEDGAVINVTYSATVNNKVKYETSMDNTGKYSFISKNIPSKPTPAEDWVTPTPYEPGSTTSSWSTELKIAKVDGNGNALTGAKFEIGGTSYKVSVIDSEVFEKDADNGSFYMLTDGTFTEDEPVMADYMKDAEQGATSGYVKLGANEEYTGDDLVVIGTDKYRQYDASTDADKHVYVKVPANADLYDSTSVKYKKVTISKDTADKSNINKAIWVDKDGIATFAGLGAGSYTITELVAPDGYNLLTQPVNVEITWNAGTKSFSAKVDSKDATIVKGVITANVVNTPGSELPATGGIGTVIFYVLGAILVLGAVVMLITRRRVSE